MHEGRGDRAEGPGYLRCAFPETIDSVFRRGATMIAEQITPQMIEAGAQAIREQVGSRSSFQGFRKLRPWDALP
jgi:hypothetical protein